MATPFEFSAGYRIEWSQCDPAGIVYYPRYYEMFDTHTNALFEAATGMDKRSLQATYGIVGWPMLESSASFKAPCTYGDRVTITSHVARFGRSSMEIRHAMTHADGRQIAEGTDKRVWAGHDPARPGGITAKALPEAFTTKFQL